MSLFLKIIQQEQLAFLLIKKLGKMPLPLYLGQHGKITKEDIDQASDTIKQSSIFLTQLEAPIEVVEYAIEIASFHNVTTILNPGPAAKLQDKTFKLIDYFTPNETEASFYVNHKVETQEDMTKCYKSIIREGNKEYYYYSWRQRCVLC